MRIQWFSQHGSHSIKPPKVDALQLFVIPELLKVPRAKPNARSAFVFEASGWHHVRFTNSFRLD